MAKKIGTLRIRALIEAVVQDILIQANIKPTSNGAANLGSRDNRFANIYTQDLQLKNDSDISMLIGDNHIQVQIDDIIITITPYLVGGSTTTTLVDGIGFSKIVGSTRLKLKNIRKVKNEIILHYQLKS